MNNNSISSILSEPEVDSHEESVNSILPVEARVSQNVSSEELSEVEKVLGKPIETVGRFSLHRVEGKYEYQGDVEVVVWEHGQELPYELPKGFFAIGGAARSVALASLGEEVTAPRDIDLVGIEEFGAGHESEISDGINPPEEYDPESGSINSLWHYFESRDFTINELLVNGKHIIGTPKAISDLQSKKIRPTQYESKAWESYANREWGVKPKLVMKAVRLKEEFINMYEEGSIEGIEDWQFEAENIPLFYIALHLDRAFESGDKVAQQFHLALLKAGVIEKRQSPDFDGSLGSNDAYELARQFSVYFFERSRGENHEHFLFSRDELNYISSSEIVGANIKDLEQEKYENMADDYIRQKGLSGEGYDEAVENREVTTVRRVGQNGGVTNSKSKAKMNKYGFELQPHHDLNSMELAFVEAMNPIG